jgi:hypothetical protein
VTPTTVPTGDVLVQVYNGSGARGVAHAAAQELATAGFLINGTSDVSDFTYTTSVIEYPPGALTSANTVLAHINGPTELEADSSVPNGEIHLILGSTFVGVAK